MVALKESMNVSHELYEISLELVSPLCWFFLRVYFLAFIQFCFHFMFFCYGHFVLLLLLLLLFVRFVEIIKILSI